MERREGSVGWDLRGSGEEDVPVAEWSLWPSSLSLILFMSPDMVAVVGCVGYRVFDRLSMK